MKKFMALCLVALMVISVLPASIFAAAEPASGKLEGTLSIKGSLRDGEVLSADLSKVKPEGIAQDQLKYEWFRIGTDGKSKSVGTGVSYTLKTEDVGSSFQLTVSGKEGASVAGSLSTGKMGPVTEKAASATGTTPAAETTPSAEPANVPGTADGEPVQGTSPENTYTTPAQPAASDSISPTQGMASGNGVSTPTQDPVSGTVSGTGDVPETSPITVQEDNGTKGEITMDASLPDGQVGVDYRVKIQTSGTVAGWEMMSSRLPDGLTWNGNTGELAGIPEKADTTSGIMIKATFEDGSTDTKSFSVTIKEVDGKAEDSDTSSANSVLEEKIKLVADLQELDFGSLYTGYDSKNMQLNLENQGTDALTLDSAVDGDLADVISVGEIGELKSGESKTVNVTLKEGLGASADVYTGTLTVKNGDESAKVEVGLKVRVEEKLYKVQASPKSIDLGTLTEGYTDPQGQEIQITNNSDFPVEIKQEGSSQFKIEGSDGTVQSGDHITYTVRPLENLSVDTHQEDLTFTVDGGAATVSVTAKVLIQEKDDYSFQLSWENSKRGDFGFAPLGYDDKNGFAPASQNLVITNTGNKALELRQPVSASGSKSAYTITELDAATLKSVAPGAQVKVAVKPKLGLAAAVYDEDILVEAVNDQGGQKSAHITFQVVDKSIYQGVDAKQGTVKAKNGVKKSVNGLGLPETVKISTTSGTKNATVYWDVKNCEYDPALKEEQSFTVQGTVKLPAGVVNVWNITRATSIGVRVLAYDSKKADTAENKIYGIGQGDTFQAGKTISFSAEGSGMNRKESPEKGDVRYEPTYWKVTNTNATWSTDGSWSKSPYSASFSIGNSGSYSLKATFTKEVYDGEKWEKKADDKNGTDIKSVSFRINGNSSSNTNKKNTVTKVKQAVKTGDDTEILPMMLLVIAGALTIGGTGIMLKNRKKKDQGKK